MGSYFPILQLLFFAFRLTDALECVAPFIRRTGKLFTKEPALPQMLPARRSAGGVETHNDIESGNLPEPELAFLLNKFHRDNLIRAEKRLKELWLSACCRHF